MGANTYLNDEERQILESATVGIAGAGGLGSNCAAHLVRAGLKRLVIADFDVVSPSNLPPVLLPRPVGTQEGGRPLGEPAAD